jgi:hypothetical protein
MAKQAANFPGTSRRRKNLIACVVRLFLRKRTLRTIAPFAGSATFEEIGSHTFG